jgi:hypothetical protein
MPGAWAARVCKASGETVKRIFIHFLKESQKEARDGQNEQRTGHREYSPCLGVIAKVLCLRYTHCWFVKKKTASRPLFVAASL